MVEINFKEKEARKKVEFKFFYSSSELKAYELINNLAKYTDKFNSLVEFTPIYVIHQSPQYNPKKSTREIYTPPKFNERCSKRTLDSIGYPVNYLDGCIAESFGVNSLLSSNYIDNGNSIFKN